MDADPLVRIENPSAVTPETAAPVEASTTAPVSTETPDPSVDWEATAKEQAQVLSTLQQERQQIASSLERQQAQQALNDWQNDEQQMIRDADQMDPDDAVRHTADFYKQREAWIVGQATRERQTLAQQMHAERVHAFATEIIRDEGLTEADRPRLLQAAMRHPNEMLTTAKSIKTERDQSGGEIAELRKQIEHLTRSQQATGMRQSGAWATGGASGSTAPTDVQAGTQQHLAGLLQGFGGRQ